MIKFKHSHDAVQFILRKTVHSPNMKSWLSSLDPKRTQLNGADNTVDVAPEVSKIIANLVFWMGEQMNFTPVPN